MYHEEPDLVDVEVATQGVEASELAVLANCTCGSTEEDILAPCQDLLHFRCCVTFVRPGSRGVAGQTLVARVRAFPVPGHLPRPVSGRGNDREYEESIHFGNPWNTSDPLQPHVVAGNLKKQSWRCPPFCAERSLR